MPECIAVHRKNYVFIRSGYHFAYHPDKPYPWHRPAHYQLAIDFDAANSPAGLSSACVLDSYLRHLRKVDTEGYLREWFNGLQLPDEAKVWFDFFGNVQYGSLPKDASPPSGR